MAITRQSIRVYGRVQGVGFRPFVYRLAKELALAGHVANDAAGAVIEVEGEPALVTRFCRQLKSELPAVASISRTECKEITVRHDRDFRIQPSSEAGSVKVEITPDMAVCQDCLREMRDPQDRRYRYPFINCTNCGPRYSIIRKIPYDRANTTMNVFRMCPQCQREYDDPADRRFHAQPNACPVCGPRLWFAGSDGKGVEGDAVRLAVDLIRQGGIVAVKGIGGFHLACRGDDAEVVAKLRERKRRDEKPFALMFVNSSAASMHARISPFARETLRSPARPIVLLPKAESSAICSLVAPGCNRWGVMLPYAPVHHLLFAEGLEVLVMTSGNPSDEPITRTNEETLERLGGIADGFLMHDREIARSLDDSVLFCDGEHAVPVRRARGFAPDPIRVDWGFPCSVLAVGAELKNAICHAGDDAAVLSEHLGDLSSPATYRNFVEAVGVSEQLLRARPRVIAHDLHPGYLSTHFAQQYCSKDCGEGKAKRPPVEKVAVQHHHAHAVSCAVDAGMELPVVGVVCDGTGYGTDGAVWGGEILLASAEDFQRLGHLRYFPLPGGDLAAKHTWRPAVSLLRAALPDSAKPADLACFAGLEPRQLDCTLRQVEADVNCPRCSSLGRLFDGVAFLTGVCAYNDYEGQAAALLEQVAADKPLAPYAYSVSAEGDVFEMDWRPMIRAVVNDVRAKVDIGEVAGRFHEAIAAMFAEAAVRVVRRLLLNRVVLSGGCFVNERLRDRTRRRLEQNGVQVGVHARVPPGDGGVALGQAVIAGAVHARGKAQKGPRRRNAPAAPDPTSRIPAGPGKARRSH